LVVHSHNIEAARWKTLGKWWWPILSFYEKQTHRSAAYNFFIREEDRVFAINTFGLLPRKCMTITYGIEWNTIPPEDQKRQCRLTLQQLHGITPSTTIFLFNGSLDYFPNLQAVKTILEKINPILLQSGIVYKIIICGKGLPPEMNALKDYANKNIIYAGFVDDISIYFKGADTFINPVVDGGGIKTKLVEALGYNMDVITTVSGAIGIPPGITGNKMKVLEDNDWNGFAATMKISNNSADIPPAFFDHFYWINIAGKAYRFITQNEKIADLGM
jgi:polysaccharide biosynthesis protein PslH